MNLFLNALCALFLSQAMYVLDTESILTAAHVCSRPIVEVEVGTVVQNPTPEEIALEELYGELELLAQLVQAEAGNQSLNGKRLVVDVVLNRVESDDFPDSITEVIYQDAQFSPVWNGRFEKAGWTVTEEDYYAVYMEYFGTRLNTGILYFNNSPETSGKDTWQYGDHWFAY